jgi:hypothetical protein
MARICRSRATFPSWPIWTPRARHPHGRGSSPAAAPGPAGAATPAMRPTSGAEVNRSARHNLGIVCLDAMSSRSWTRCRKTPPAPIDRLARRRAWFLLLLVLGCSLAALATGRLLLGRRATLLGVSTFAGGLPTVLGRIRGVRDPGGALLAHPLSLSASYRFGFFTFADFDGMRATPFGRSSSDLHFPAPPIRNPTGPAIHC